jgi:hypothetical protein
VFGAKGCGVLRLDAISGRRLDPEARVFHAPLRSAISRCRILLRDRDCGVFRLCGLSGPRLVGDFAGKTLLRSTISCCQIVLDNDGCGVICLWGISGRESAGAFPFSARLRWTGSSDSNGLSCRGINLDTFENALGQHLVR